MEHDQWETELFQTLDTAVGPWLIHWKADTIMAKVVTARSSLVLQLIRKLILMSLSRLSGFYMLAMLSIALDLL